LSSDAGGSTSPATNQAVITHREADAAKVDFDPVQAKAHLEAELAKIKGVTQGLKEIFETPGWATVLQGAGQWLTLTAENTKALSEQNHERQKLKMTQEHERAMQLDKLNVSAQQRREGLGLVLVFGATLLAVAIIALGLVAIKWGWIDEKTATIACLIIGTVFTQARRWTNDKSTPSSAPPAQTP
jgi:hypothetical protein